ncbi:MAG: hypothetical protein Q9222_003623 [Ikaeria aurantiellina]
MATIQNGPSPPVERSRLSTHFDVPNSRHLERWASLWAAGDFLPWDRGAPNPAFVDLLDQKEDRIGDCFVTEYSGGKRRKKALVPGCGRGYDVLLLASHGYDAYGLEVNDEAVKKCLEEQKINGDKYPAKDTTAGVGKSTFLKGDFFASEWSHGMAFDLIYDYTLIDLMQFFCALNPAMRPAWAQKMSQLLERHPSGFLVCVEFPTYKDPSIGGPPFGLTPDTYVAHLSQPGQEIPYDEAGHVKPGGFEQPAANGLERLDHWRPERTHEIGKGTDWMSVWKHR